MKNLSAQIRGLPHLNRYAQFTSTKSCKICHNKSIIFDIVDFNKYCSNENFYEFGLSGIGIKYHRCLFCGFIFTLDFDDWSDEDFSQLIYNADYILVDGEYEYIRPKLVADAFSRRIRGCENARILDYGSGAGVFVDEMRGFGFRNIEAYDPFSSPKPPSGEFDIITCFEVIEHSSDPVGMLGKMRSMLREDGCIIMSQTVQPPDILSVRGNWWYLAPRNGHISTYSEEALVILARHHGFTVHKGSNVYGFATNWPSSFARHALASVGPSFTTLRLMAPQTLLDAPIAFPSRNDIHWYPAESDGLWTYRWTGDKSIRWDARWGSVATLQLRVPIHIEAEPGFAVRCEFELGGQRLPAQLDRGELTANFDVRGRTFGVISLHSPEPIEFRDVKPGHPAGPHGLAVLVSQDPSWPESAAKSVMAAA